MIKRLCKKIWLPAICVLVGLLLPAGVFAATRPDGKNGLYVCTVYIGGAAAALDALDITGAGAPNTYDLIEGDQAMVGNATDGWAFYTFDADGTDAEDATGFTVIRPDDYATAGVWKLAPARAASLIVTTAHPVTMGGTGETTAEGARTALGLAIGVDIEAKQTAASEAEMLALTEANIKSMSPLRIAQGIAAWLGANGLKQTALTAEPASEQIGQIVFADSTWDPAAVGQDAWVMCTATGTPGTWIAILGADGTLYMEIPLFKAVYASTGAITFASLFNGLLTNYGQSADATLTFETPTEDTISAGFKIVDISNALLFRPASGEQLLFEDATGTKELLGVNEGISCPAAGNAVGDKLLIEAIQIGASSYRYHITQVSGDGCSEETP